VLRVWKDGVLIFDLIIFWLSQYYDLTSIDHLSLYLYSIPTERYQHHELWIINIPLVLQWVVVIGSYAFILRIRIIIDTRRGRIGMLIHRRPQTSTMYHTTIKQGRSAASMWGWRGGVVHIRGIKPDFHSFGASKMGWCFTYFWYQWDTLLNVWIKQQLTNR